MSSIVEVCSGRRRAKRRVLSTFVLSTLAMVGVIGIAAPVDAVTPGITRVAGLTSFGGMAVTATNVYLTGGPGVDLVAVMGADGTRVGTLTGVDGAEGLVVDGGILYVASVDASRIDRFDLTTDPPVQLSPFDTSAVGPPRDIAVIGGKLWFTTCTDTYPYADSVASIPLDAGDPVTAVSDAAWAYCPEIHAGPHGSDLLFVHNGGLPNSRLVEYDVSTGTLVHVATSTWYHHDPGTIVPLPGEATFATSSGSYDPVRVYAIDDLTATGQTYDGPGLAALAATGDAGGLLAGSSGGSSAWGDSDVTVWSLGDPAPIVRYSFETTTVWDGLAFAGSEGILYAVSKAYTTPARIYLHVLRPTPMPGALTVVPSAKLVPYGASVRLEVATAPAVAGSVSLMVDPIDGPETVIATKPADEDGSTVFSVRPDVASAYRAHWTGLDAWTEAWSAPVTVRVRHVVTGTLRRPYAVSGDVSLFHRTQRVLYLTQVTPPHPGRRTSYLFQYRLDGAWRYAGEQVVAQDDAGRSGIYFPARSLDTGRYRIRAEFSGDREHVEGRTPWAMFRVTN